MNTRRALLDALHEGSVSGPTLAEELGVSRAAVWKTVESLREEGFAVESTDDGYVAPTNPGYSAAGIEFGLDAPYAVEYHDSLSSTNDRGRELANQGAEDIAVVTDEQTGGRGRLDREFVSPSGGVWLSIVTRPAVSPARAPLYTLASAVAIVDACQRVGVDTHIKWPNDVLVGSDHADSPADSVGRSGRKLAGILTEMEGEADRVSWLVVGIGVNANIDTTLLPAGATSLSEELGDDVDLRRVAATILERYATLTAPDCGLETVLPAWREHASTLGRRVRVETARGPVVGTAVDVESSGALVVDTGNGTKRIHAGDCEHLRDVAD